MRNINLIHQNDKYVLRVVDPKAGHHDNGISIILDFDEARELKDQLDRTL